MKTHNEQTNTTPGMELDIFQPATQTGITRRTFLKRTVSTTLAVALALNSFKAESYAQQGGNSGGQYGITITIIGKKVGVANPGSGGSSSADQGAAIEAALTGAAGITVTPLITNKEIVPKPITISANDESFSVNIDANDNVSAINYDVPANTAKVIIITWGQPKG